MLSLLLSNSLHEQRINLIVSLRLYGLIEGGEFLGHKFIKFLKEKEISQQTSVAQLPQQNRRVEHWQQMIQNKAKAMHHHASLTSGF